MAIYLSSLMDTMLGSLQHQMAGPHCCLYHSGGTSNPPPSGRVFLQHREATSPSAKMIMCHTCHQDETSSAHFPSWGPSPGHCGRQLQLPLLHPSQVPGWGYKTSGSCSLQNFCNTPEALAMGRCKRSGHHTCDCP